MSTTTGIEWTDSTFNPWRGCTKVSPGCANCYAETLSHRNPKVLGEWGPGKPRVQASEAYWREPLKWNLETFGICAECGPKNDATKEGRCPNCTRVDLWYPRRRRVFCASLADWLDDEVPIAWLARLLQTIHATPNLDWQLLTKRPQNWKERINQASVSLIPSCDFETVNWIDAWWGGKAPENVWFGTTVEDQIRADERLPLLLDIPAKVHFLSCEPLLGPVRLKWFAWNADRQSKGLPEPLYSSVRGLSDLPGIDWVICGGESGDKARPMHPEWARSLRDQCASAKVPFFFKQWGEWIDVDKAPENREFYSTTITASGERISSFGPYQKGSAQLAKVGKKTAGSQLDGREHKEFPKA